MPKYLYGASVQGIQGFIFQTNKLREIAGASELVEQICTTTFFDTAGITSNNENIMLAAAGNIKYVFTDKTACEAFVKVFPKAVMEMASGITISQAVVEFKGEVSNATTQELEDRLRIQRNKAIQIPSANLMVSEIARSTGGAGIEFRKDRGDIESKAIDLAQKHKLDSAHLGAKSLLKKIVGSSESLIKKFPFEMDEIAESDLDNWVAVVHADGNNLGIKIMKMVEILNGNKTQQAIKEFSKILNDSTVQAARDAFNAVIYTKKEGKYPFRPVVLGGDDLTAIIRGDLAIEFTKIFLAQFEKHTTTNFQVFAREYGLEKLFGNGLTACAGIAFIKATYPFHYGVKLSESLCKDAKKVSKNIEANHTPSSLVFHKVHASFVEEYEDVVKKELTTKDGIQFNYGPYFIHNQKDYFTIDELQRQVEGINEKDAPKAGLRTWLTEIKNDKERADQLMERIKTLNRRYDKDFSFSNPFTERSKKQYTPLFDIISLSNIKKPKDE